MRYTKKEAKAYSRANFKGVWAAALTPFNPDLSVNETALRSNLEHWVHTLNLKGLFVGGKQGEFFSMSVAERKRGFELAVEVAAERNGECGIITSCSDTNLDVVLDLARYSERIGADYIVVHSPVFHFGADTDETIYEYYRYLSEQLDIGIALWNHPDCGYIMSPELCSRIADLPNIVAIKYSVPRELYTKLTHLAGDRILVSTASEEEWLDNIIELKWQLYLCSSPPYLLQTAHDQRINQYSALAFNGEFDEARALSASLQVARDAFKRSKPKGKPQAHSKYWQELLGQAGGPVRRPLLQLTDSERKNIDLEFAHSGLRRT
jgi:4-hydroxy-tetrahydrodipicolinate synthase